MNKVFFRDMNGTSFVCLDDIAGVPVKLNKVIYNPNIDDKSIIPDRLFNGVQEYFGVKLSPSEIQHLISYDANHLDEFANDLRQLVKNKRGA